ncbi:hypothetical protein ACIQRC_34945 [Streptomyces californicus]|uniref:hypothetical protein n=1 Tax=Streptomyces californicus TaxID=67351 RepID=UPI00381FB5B3
MSEPAPADDRIPGGIFHGPTAFQVGDHNTMHNRFVTEKRSPADAAADNLARAVATQWRVEAGLRRLLSPSPLPVRWALSGRRIAGRAAGAVESSRKAGFDPLPGLAPVTEEILRNGGELTALHAVYGGLPAGRLLLVGPPAAGKTAATVLLLLTALRHRQQAAPADRPHIPVPVLLTLEGWDPAAESAVEWAAGRLSRQYTSLSGARGRESARVLLNSGRIALFLDGLDEVTAKLRAAMVAALEPTPCRLVLVSRSKEAVLTGKKARLAGATAVELHPVRPEDAADFLLDPLPEPAPEPWRAVADRLIAEPKGVLARALSSPLAVGLVREVYTENGPVDELLDTTRFSSPRAVEDHLLDHAITAAYTPRSGYPRPDHTPEEAERALRHIAAQLTAENTHDLAWWHIPSWVDARPRAIAVGAIFGLINGTVATWSFWPIGSAISSCLAGMLVAAVFGLLTYKAIVQLRQPAQLSSSSGRDIFPRGSIVSGFQSWLLTSSVVAVVSWTMTESDPTPLWLCAAAGAPFGFAATMAHGRGYRLTAGSFLYINTRTHGRLRRQTVPASESRSIGPRPVWHHHARLRVLLGLMNGVAIGLLAGVFGSLSSYEPELVLRLVVAATVWPAIYSGLVENIAFSTTLTAVQLNARAGTPVRLVRFLDDAHRRNLLRAVGPVYQFRHARLQERLARDH